MKEYLMFIGLLSFIYLGYLVVRAREKRMMRRYYGYTRTRRSRSLKKAA